MLGATGFYHRVGAPWLQGSGPLPGPMPQGVYYVQIIVVYISNTLPAGAALPRRRSWPIGGGAMLNFAITEFSEVAPSPEPCYIGR